MHSRLVYKGTYKAPLSSSTPQPLFAFFRCQYQAWIKEEGDTVTLIISVMAQCHYTTAALSGS